MLRVTAIFIVLLAVSGASRAADDVAADAIPAPNPERFANGATFDWSGARLGIHGGYGWSSYGASDGDGALGGAHAGYDYQFGRGVVGVETSVSAGDVEIAPGSSLETVVDVRARLGFAMDRVLVYGTAGGAYGSAEGGLDDTGWTAGAGLDFSATPNTIAGMEYVRYRFKNFANTGNTLDIDLVKGKITYKF